MRLLLLLSILIAAIVPNVLTGGLHLPLIMKAPHVSGATQAPPVSETPTLAPMTPIVETALPAYTTSPKPTHTPTATEQALYTCSSNTYNCGSFSSQAEAQTVYEYCLDRGAGDIHQLDGDSDGTACESYDYPGGFKVIR